MIIEGYINVSKDIAGDYTAEAKDFYGYKDYDKRYSKETSPSSKRN
jgi:hypothetical protein